MDNYVFHTLHIGGDPASLRTLYERAFFKDTKNIDFSEFIPVPQEYQSTVAEGARETRFTAARVGFYEWSRFHWGTPVEPLDSSQRWLDSGELNMSFTTAVSPALPVLKAIAQRYPLLTIKGFFYASDLVFYGLVNAKGN